MVAGVGGFVGGRVSYAPQTITKTETITETETLTETKISTETKTVTETSVATLPPVSVTEIHREILTTTTTVTTTETYISSHPPVTTTMTETVTRSYPYYITATQTITYPYYITVTQTYYITVTQPVTLTQTVTVTTTVAQPSISRVLDKDKTVNLPAGTDDTFYYDTPRGGYVTVSFTATGGVYFWVGSSFTNTYYARYPITSPDTATRGSFTIPVPPGTMWFYVRNPALLGGVTVTFTITYYSYP